MVTSIEPGYYYYYLSYYFLTINNNNNNIVGYYENGNFGIRIENLVEVVELSQFEAFGGRSFLGFKKLTQIPIQKKLLKMELLTNSDINWLNTYHSEIITKVTPYLKTERAKKWLINATTPIMK